MCCQPPKKIDDINYLYTHNIKVLQEAPKDLPIIGISGGEPTLLGDKLFDLICYIRKNFSEETTIHLLSNGRTFQNAEYTHKLKECAGNNIFVGIPLHSDYCKDHDIIAGTKGAYNEMMHGLYNLANERIEIELRVIINAINYMRLPNIAQFIFKNLPFVSWTAFMAMEEIGLAVKNFSKIWIEPTEYIDYIKGAVDELSTWGMETSIYNIPLCLLPESLHLFAAKSISDWKVKFLDICDSCIMRNMCCGLFATSNEIFKGIKPYNND